MSWSVRLGTIAGTGGTLGTDGTPRDDVGLANGSFALAQSEPEVAASRHCCSARIAWRRVLLGRVELASEPNVYKRRAHPLDLHWGAFRLTLPAACVTKLSAFHALLRSRLEPNDACQGPVGHPSDFRRDPLTQIFRSFRSRFPGSPIPQ